MSFAGGPARKSTKVFFIDLANFEDAQSLDEKISDIIATNAKSDGNDNDDDDNNDDNGDNVAPVNLTITNRGNTKKHDLFLHLLKLLSSTNALVSYPLLTGLNFQGYLQVGEEEITLIESIVRNVQANAKTPSLQAIGFAFLSLTSTAIAHMASLTHDCAKKLENQIDFPIISLQRCTWALTKEVTAGDVIINIQEYNFPIYFLIRVRSITDQINKTKAKKFIEACQDLVAEVTGKIGEDFKIKGIEIYKSNISLDALEYLLSLDQHFINDNNNNSVNTSEALHNDKNKETTSIKIPIPAFRDCGLCGSIPTNDDIPAVALGKFEINNYHLNMTGFDIDLSNGNFVAQLVRYTVLSSVIINRITFDKDNIAIDTISVLLSPILDFNDANPNKQISSISFRFCSFSGSDVTTQANPFLMTWRIPQKEVVISPPTVSTTLNNFSTLMNLLVDTFPFNTTRIVKITLDRNPIESQGMSLLAKKLNYTHWQELSLDGVNVTDEDMEEALIPALNSNTTLKCLNLSGNNGLTTKSVDGLSDLLKNHNMTLSKILLARCMEILRDNDSNYNQTPPDNNNNCSIAKLEFYLRLNHFDRQQILKDEIHVNLYPFLLSEKSPSIIFWVLVRKLPNIVSPFQVIGQKRKK